LSFPSTAASAPTVVYKTILNQASPLDWPDFCMVLCCPGDKIPNSLQIEKDMLI